MKALVIDNEENIRKGLVNNLRNFTSMVSIVEEADGVEVGIRKIKEFKPEVVFLDVEMDDGTGFELIEKLGEVTFQLIFITAHDKYAVNAFKLSALDFLLKPIDEDDLEDALKKAKNAINTLGISEQLNVLRASLSDLKSSDQKIVLQDSKSIYFIKISDIYNCEAEGSYTTFYLEKNEKIVVSKPIKDYEAMLEPYGFIRTHHSHLVNIKKIVRYDKTDGGSLILENLQHVPVSQRKKEQVMETISRNNF